MTKNRKLTFTALMCALAYIAVAFGRIPISSVEFLKYDPKDVIIVISGFLFGPVTTISIALVVSFIEMVTISSTGIIGFFMNVLSTVAFAFTASSIYRSNRTMRGALTGLFAGILAQTSFMIIWNYAVTPIYYGMPREAVAGMLIPVFLPFNLIKSGLNTALTLILYKPFVTVMARLGILQPHSAPKRKISLGVIITSVVILIMCIVSIMIMK